MVTVHVVFHAHLDPIWLWPWQAGLDSAIATSRSACDLLDANPDAVFTQGEAWAHHVVGETDPSLLERIRQHVAAGRWSLAGGWWIQPDCNSASGVGLERQISIGKDYLLRTFGRGTEVAFNVDSFGHASTLPGFMAAEGQKYYVMMRPQEHEMALPKRIFRWRGYTDGPEVLTFRIAGRYCACPLSEEHVRASLTELPEGIAHTMCFAGVGDHGGGATQALIDWVRDNENAIDGVRLVFSSPERFFSEIEAQREMAPEVVGELQHHAIGCYTVHRPVKTACRRAENRLAQAETVLRGPSEDTEDARRDVARAWEHACFHQFHDTMGGTCLPSAYETVAGELGGAAAVAEKMLALAMRRRMNSLPDCADQQVVLLNPSDQAFDDYVEFEPWMERGGWGESFALLDDGDTPVPYQAISCEALVGRGWPGRLLIKTPLGPGAMKALRIVDRPDLQVAPAAGATAALDLAAGTVSRPGESTLPVPVLHLIDDPTDTWSHGIDRFAEGPFETATWGEAEQTEAGPLMTEWTQPGRIGASELLAFWRVYAGSPFAELRLRVDWNEKNKILKLVQRLDALAPTERIDGIPGGALARALDGRELPLRGWTWVGGDQGALGIVCPEVYALDATPERLRLTLLRSPQMAHHDPCPGGALRGRYSDRGEHDFLCRLYLGERDTAALDAVTGMLGQPPIAADLTRGMPRTW